MADALCGPSNPLQNFQKHSNVDRTLQQDRLVSRHSPSQGFRSSPGPSAGSLDPEFEAFQAGIATGPAPLDLQQFPHQPLPLRSAEPPSQLSGWASNFQRLHISPQSQSPAPFSPPQAQAHRQSPASWHQDFLQQHRPQISATPPQLQQHTSFQSSFPSMSHYGMQGPTSYQPMFAQRPAMTIAQGKQREQSISEGQWDDEAFERAFDTAQQEMLSTEEDFTEAFQADLQNLGQQLDSEKADTMEALERDIMAFKEAVHDDPLADQHDILDAIEAEALARQRFENEKIQDEKQDMRPPDPEMDADELSRTAGQLLESVSHDTSEKFQQSSFLSLMRRLRDREVRVEGDKMVESQSLTPASMNEPLEPLLHDRIDPVLQDTDDGRLRSPSDSNPELLQELPKSNPTMSGAINRSEPISNANFADDIDLAISASVRSQMAEISSDLSKPKLTDQSRLNLYRLPIEAMPSSDEEEWAS